jgi:hypothetical protein
LSAGFFALRSEPADLYYHTRSPGTLSGASLIRWNRVWPSCQWSGESGPLSWALPSGMLCCSQYCVCLPAPYTPGSESWRCTSSPQSQVLPMWTPSVRLWVHMAWNDVPLTTATRAVIIAVVTNAMVKMLLISLVVYHSL